MMSLFPIAHAGVITEATPISTVLWNMLEFLLQIFAVVAIIAFLGAGILYLLSGGNEQRIQKARRWMLYAVFGIVIALGSLIIVSTLSAFFS